MLHFAKLLCLLHFPILTAENGCHLAEVVKLVRVRDGDAGGDWK